MTEYEIVKDLECCKGYLTNDCAICQNVEKYPRCNEFLNNIALDLINRQKAEIERLKKDFDTMCFVTAKRWVKNAKSEAIKEFAERLKENHCFTDRWGKIITISNVDDLVKEMTEVD